MNDTLNVRSFDLLSQEKCFSKKLRLITDLNLWSFWESGKLIWLNRIDEEKKSVFHTYWTEAGHHIGNQIDDDVLIKLLREVLPAYNGPKLVLYRGENLDRYNDGEIGLCWTNQQNIAEMYGRGLNAVYSGGIFLESVVSSNSIIAGPSKHSLYLSEHEYTIDPNSLTKITPIRRYPKNQLAEINLPIY